MGRSGLRADLIERDVRAANQLQLVVPESEADARRLRAALSRGDLVSPASGVYAVPATWDELKPTERARRTIRTLAKLHPDWVFCGISAALMYGLAVSFSLCGLTYIATTRRASDRGRSARGIVRRVVEGDESKTVDEICVTSLARTLLDCLRSVSFRDGLAIADSALHMGIAKKEDLEEVFRHSAHRLSGRRQAIETLPWANGLAESGGESIARAVMIERGFRLPELQHEICDPIHPANKYRVDFWWELDDGHAVAGELDGHEKYVNPKMTGGKSVVDVLTDERLRESRLSGSDVRVMRFSYTNIMDRWGFTRLLCGFGIPRDAEVPRVAWRSDDPECRLSVRQRMELNDSLHEQMSGSSERRLSYGHRNASAHVCV